LLTAARDYCWNEEGNAITGWADRGVTKARRRQKFDPAKKENPAKAGFSNQPSEEA
jgi:hypothetical protein